MFYSQSNTSPLLLYFRWKISSSALNNTLIATEPNHIRFARFQGHPVVNFEVHKRAWKPDVNIDLANSRKPRLIHTFDSFPYSGQFIDLMRMNDVIGRKQFRFLSNSIHTGHASKKIDKRLNKNKVPREPPVNMSSKSSPVKLNKPELVLKQWCQHFVTPFQKPWTQSNVLYHYIPLFGAIDYHILALNVLNPKLLINLGRRWATHRTF